MKRRNRRRHQGNTETQTLELRELKTGVAMGSTPTQVAMFNSVSLNDGVLTIQGTQAADQITVSESLATSGRRPVRNLDVRVQSSPGTFTRISRFPKSLVTTIHVFGRRGHDTIRIDTDVPSVLKGQGGNDTLLGGSGDDQIEGNGGHDQILGRNGNDQLKGGQRNDTLYGGAGDDSIFGGSHSDWATGGSGADQLDGDSGNDTLLGGSGNDRLFGGGDNDRLDGERGADGVFGGLGQDTLTGGTGGDRFLLWHDQPGTFQSTHNDTVNDLDGNDAEVRFIDTDHSTVSTWHTYAAWSEDEIETLDQSLEMLMDRTGNTDLLKQHNGNVMEIKRFGDSRDGGGALATNNDMRIAMLDRAFAGDDIAANYILLHEIGHFWDEARENDFVSDFRDISGWRKGRVQTGESESGEEGDRWVHDASAAFVSAYASFNPKEDWAESFATNMMVRAGFPVEGIWAGFNNTSDETVNASNEKMDHLDQFFADLS